METWKTTNHQHLPSTNHLQRAEERKGKNYQIEDTKRYSESVN
jgi:hypothetical protein